MVICKERSYKKRKEKVNKQTQIQKPFYSNPNTKSKQTNSYCSKCHRYHTQVHNKISGVLF